MGTSPARIKRALASGAVIPVMLIGVPLAGMPSAGAATCTHPAWQNLSPGAGKAKTAGTPLRTGPYEACAVVRTVGTSIDLFYHCWVENSYGNKWTHVRVANTETSGWVYNGNLNDGGSVHPDNRCYA
jgi:hypothetical protein